MRTREARERTMETERDKRKENKDKLRGKDRIEEGNNLSSKLIIIVCV